MVSLHSWKLQVKDKKIVTTQQNSANYVVWYHLNTYRHYQNIPLVPGLILRPPNVWEHRPKRFGFQQHQDIQALELSSDNCPLCSLIYKAVTQFNENVKQGPRNENGRKLQSAGPKDFRLQITANDSDQDGFMIWTDATIDTYIFLVTVVSFCVENGKIQNQYRSITGNWSSINDPLSHRFQGWIVDEDPSSPKALDRISEWVKTCDEHKRYKPDLVSLPTRVLHVGDQTSSSRIRLWETGGEIGSYTTLSHAGKLQDRSSPHLRPWIREKKG